MSAAAAEGNARGEADLVARDRTRGEHWPWVVERAAKRRPFDDLLAGLMAPLHAATPEGKVTLIRAHPELAGKAAIDGTLTAASAAEQASAGLARAGQAGSAITGIQDGARRVVQAVGQVTHDLL